jgi:hypothetical protein
VFCGASSLILIDEHVAVGGVGGVVFLFEITIEATDLFPFHDRQHRIERIEIGNLDVGGIKVVDTAAGDGAVDGQILVGASPW